MIKLDDKVNRLRCMAERLEYDDYYFNTDFERDALELLNDNKNTVPPSGSYINQAIRAMERACLEFRTCHINLNDFSEKAHEAILTAIYEDHKLRNRL